MPDLSHLKQKIKRRWYLLANRCSACIYQSDAYSSFDFLKRLSLSEGKLKETLQESIEKESCLMRAEKNGAFRNAHKGDGNDFAKAIAEHLEAEARRGIFSELILVSEPRFLGSLRQALSSHVRSLITKEINREYSQVPRKTIAEKLIQTLNPDSLVTDQSVTDQSFAH